MLQPARILLAGLLAALVFLLPACFKHQPIAPDSPAMQRLESARQAVHAIQLELNSLDYQLEKASEQEAAARQFISDQSAALESLKAQLKRYERDKSLPKSVKRAACDLLKARIADAEKEYAARRFDLEVTQLMQREFRARRRTLQARLKAAQARLQAAQVGIEAESARQRLLEAEIDTGTESGL